MIRVDVRLVRLLVTVKDNAGRLIGSLNKEDFSVYDSGVRQQLSVFERHTEQPLSVALLVDTSASTGKDLQYEVGSAARFLRALVGEGNPEDTAALYSFNWQVTLQSSFTRRVARLESGLHQLHPEGGTSLYDALWLASEQLEGRPGRHVIVIVSDGADTTSYKGYASALEAAHRADAVLYPILVVPITNPAGRNTGGENALTTLASSTGGRIFYPSGFAELDAAFADILRELRTQYLVGYYPKDLPAASNRFHTVQVGVRYEGLRVTTRAGYYGDVDESSGQWQRR